MGKSEGVYLSCRFSNMTTTFVYKYYDVYSEKHTGNFPHVHWSGPPIALYGCPQVKARLEIFPNGDNCTGTVSIFVLFLCDNPELSLDAKIEIQLGNKKEKSARISVGHGNEKDAIFGIVGQGWPDFWDDIGAIYKGPLTAQFKVKILQFTEKKEKQEIVTQPTGEQTIVLYSENVREVEENVQREERTPKRRRRKN